MSLQREEGDMKERILRATERLLSGACCEQKHVDSSQLHSSLETNQICLWKRPFSPTCQYLIAVALASLNLKGCQKDP